MSDLNKYLRHKKAGAEISPEIFQHFIDLYDKSTDGPICCFFVGTLRDNPARRNGYSSNGMNTDKKVIGCSRGYLLLEESENGTYREKLCKGCVAEAVDILANGHKKNAPIGI